MKAIPALTLASMALTLASMTNITSASEQLIRQAREVQTLTSAFTTKVPGLINDHIMLGTGYNRDTSEFLNVQTVDGTVIEALGNTLATTKLVNNSSYADVLEQLNGSIDIDISFPLVRVDAGGHIATEMAASHYSNSWSFQAWLTPKKRTLKAHDSNVGFTLTPAGNTVANQYQGKMMDLVGDSFVSEIEYGAQLLVNLKVEYLSEQHKSDIGGNLGVSYGVGSIGVSVDGELRYIDEDLKKSVIITVQAIQKGGDPKQLLSIIPNNIISCTLDNYEPCFELFVQATEYARNDFAGQFNALSDYNVVRYTASSYGNSSLEVRQLDATSQQVSLATTVQTLWLEDAFKTAIGHEHRARALLVKYSSWLSDTQSDAAADVKQAAYDSAVIYHKYALECRDNPYGTACTDNWNNYLAACGTGDYPACLDVYSVADLNIDAGGVTQFFKCETAREATANFGVENNDTSIAFRALSLAPIFVDADDPAAGVMAWTACNKSLPSYGSAFE
jgi:hypothetical protein